jgi:thiamine biosynthesis lipoprotein
MENLKFSAKISNIAICGVVFLSLLCGCQNQKLYKKSKILMGTFIEITSSDERAAAIAFKEISRLDNLLSKYKENSDIWQLNKLGKARVSQDTIYVINKAKQFSKDTDGVFDITVEPLLEIWGFKDQQYRIPAQEEITEALKLVGTDKIIIDETNSTIEFKAENMAIDLGGIAKGYAVDKAVEKLKEIGIKDALINAGGDIFSLGEKFSGKWQIAIRDPRSQGVIKDLKLRDKAIATSGDYQAFFIVNERRLAHIINPQTGYPCESGVISVSVVADDCLTADALATSIFILGKDKGEQLAKRFNSRIVSFVTQ